MKHYSSRNNPDNSPEQLARTTRQNNSLKAKARRKIAGFCALGLLSISTFSLAQTPTPTPPPDNEPYPMPAGPEVVPSDYQPSAYSDDHTVLRRLRFTPDRSVWGAGPYPAVVVIHPGAFKEYDAYGVPSQRYAEKDLLDAGFLVFSIDHRLAPVNTIKNQYPHDDTPEGIASGRPPQQSNDVKQQILAAKYDSQCNQVVFVIGGSSGATHALWSALDPEPTVPGWSAAEFPRAVVGLSGAYDLALRVPTPPQDFIEVIDNYTNTAENDDGHAYQYSKSPIALIAAASDIPPIQLYTTDNDPVVPHYQTDEMYNALLGHSAVQEVTIHNSSLHAFNYWHTLEDNGTTYVSTDVISFFQAHLP